MQEVQPGPVKHKQGRLGTGNTLNVYGQLVSKSGKHSLDNRQCREDGAQSRTLPHTTLQITQQVLHFKYKTLNYKTQENRLNNLRVGIFTNK